MALTKTERLQILETVDLYPVISTAYAAGRASLEVLVGALAGGVKIVQLREKEMAMGELYELALAYRQRTAAAQALLMVNDHIDLALAMEADGVHLGQDDFPLAAARRIAPELILGRSTHNLRQALEAQEQGADYVNIGPIFPTGTKPEHKVFLGPQAIREIGPRLRIPFTVMGGIHAGNIGQVVAAGARRIAVVTAVTQAPDIAAAVRELRRIILGAERL